MLEIVFDSNFKIVYIQLIWEHKQKTNKMADSSFSIQPLVSILHAPETFQGFIMCVKTVKNANPFVDIASH